MLLRRQERIVLSKLRHSFRIEAEQLCGQNSAQLEEKEIILLRDYLITVSILNCAQRPEPARNFTAEQFTQAKKLKDGKWFVAVKDHKTG